MLLYSWYQKWLFIWLDHRLATNSSRSWPPGIWNSDRPLLIYTPSFLWVLPWALTASLIRFSALRSWSSVVGRCLSFEVLDWPDFWVEGPTLLGASRSANAFARWPRWRRRMWNISFSLVGCVAYARMEDWKAFRAESLFCVSSNGRISAFPNRESGRTHYFML